MAASIGYLRSIGYQRIKKHENGLLKYGTELLSRIPGLTIIGHAENKAAIISFVLNGVHPHDIGTLLDEEGIAIRTGHHCTQPVMERFKVPATARVSISIYNNREDMYKLYKGLQRVRKIFK